MIVVKVYKNFYTAKTNKGIIPPKPVGTYKGNPMLVLPALLIADLHIASELFAVHTLHGHGECEWSVWCGDCTPIAVGLLGKTLHHLNLHCRWIRQKLAIPFHRTQICGRQYHYSKWLSPMRFQRIWPLPHGLSFSILSHTNIGRPTIWSSGTKPQ